MAITLSEMIKKAKDKGIKPTSEVKDKPWYGGSVLKEKDNKRPTKRKQTTNKPSSINRQQTDNKQATNRQHNSSENQQQTTNKAKTNDQQSENKRPTNHPAQTDNKQTTNRQQIASKIVDGIVENQSLFEDLVGLQRTLFAYIVSACVENKLPKTKPLFVSDFILFAETDIKTVKTSLYRLEKKEVIYREKFKSGRGGWTIYGLPQKTWEKINEILG